MFVNNHHKEKKYIPAGNPPVKQKVAKNPATSLIDNRPYSVIQKKRAVTVQEKKSTDFSNTEKVVQGKIIFNGGAFNHNGTRPAWRKSLKSWTAGVYNLHKDLVGGAHNITNKTNIGNMGLARTHKIPFHTLQLVLEGFCNGAQNLAQLTTFTNLVVKPTSTAAAAVMVKLNALHTAVVAYHAVNTAAHRNAVIRTANQLLGELHNSVDNVLIGDSAKNSGIAERGDWNFARGTGTSGVLTPISRDAYHAMLPTPYNPGLYMPGGHAIAASHITSFSPTTIHHPVPVHNFFTTRYWRGNGFYQNGWMNAGVFMPPGNY